MVDLQAAKAVVRQLHDELAGATPGTVAGVLARHVADDWLWRGMHPFHIQRGPNDVATQFWAPLMTALRPLQRRADIFIAGLNEIDGFESVWVVQMGHFMGLFDNAFLGIRPTGKIVMLRFVEFNRVVDGRIAETAMFFDIPHLMMQAGQNPFPPQTGAHLIQPGPMTHDGLNYDVQDPAAGRATLAAINAMLNNPGAKFHDPDEASRLARVWRDEMIWWGPAGIGATYTIDRYITQHCMPFDASLSDGYRFNGHLCRLAEGAFGGFFGWANLTLTNSGGYMGMTAGPGPAEMRVVDMYRVQDGKLAENWIFIDILHYLSMQGLDVLGRMKALAYP